MTPHFVSEEQSPGRRKPTSPDESASPLRLSVATLLRQRSHNSATAQPPPSSAQDDLDNSSSSVASTNVFTATTSTFTAVCSLDDPQSSAPTRSDARDFIMDRFLPAAHAMACDSPQPPTGRLPYPSPSTFCRSTPQRSSLPSRSPTSPYLSRGRTVIPVFDDSASLDDDADDDPEDDHGPQSKNMCGMFSFSCANSVVRSHHSSDDSYSLWSKQPKKTAPRRMTLGDMLKEDRNDQEDMVTRPLRENAQKTRAPKSREPVADSRNSPFHRVCLPEGGEAQEFYHAPSRLSPSMCVSPYRNEPTTSPFLQNKSFLGFPGDRPVNDVNREADEASCFETPRASVGDTNIVVSKNGYVYLSPFASVLPQQSRSPTNESRFQIASSSSNNAYLAERIAPEAGHHANPDPARASGYQPVAVDPVLQQPRHSKNGEILAHENIAARNFISNLSTNSPNRCFETKEWQKTDPPVGMLCPPLPKSPSASWQWRSIPPATTNRSSTNHRKASIQEARMSSNEAPKDAKWETIVKGSQIQAGHLRSSKELDHQSPSPTRACTT